MRYLITIMSSLRDLTTVKSIYINISYLRDLTTEKSIAINISSLRDFISLNQYKILISDFISLNQYKTLQWDYISLKHYKISLQAGCPDPPNKTAGFQQAGIVDLSYTFYKLQKAVRNDRLFIIKCLCI